MDNQAAEGIKKWLEHELGIPYEEFDNLDIDEQHKIISQYHKKHNNRKSDMVPMMIGSLENASFIEVKKGEMVMIGEGENSIFVEAGLTLEEEKRRVDDALDEIICNEPLTKKLNK